MRTGRRGVSFTAALALLALPAVAQAQNYVVTTTPTSMTSIVGAAGTTVHFDGSVGTYDDQSANVALPFTFYFFGNPYTDIDISTNGYATFGSTATDFTNDPLPTAGTPNDIIALFWDDLYVGPNGTNDMIVSGVQGTAPNRIMILEWRSVTRLGGTANYLYGQIQLFEGSNVIELHYGIQDWVDTPTFSVTIGIEGPGGTEAYGGPNLLNTNDIPPTNNYIFSPVPDLAVNSVSLSTYTVAPGGGLTVTRVMENIGYGPTGGPFRYSIRLSTNNIISTGDLDIYNFTFTGAAEQLPGWLSSLGIGVTIPAGTTPGMYWIGVIVDDLFAISEVGESNNYNFDPIPLVVGSVAVCGNGITEAGEDCDGGGETASCDANCTFVVCGDNTLNMTAGEVCDDGNTTSGDGCSANCLSTEICGNAIVDVGEVCDDGNTVSGDGCSANCLSTEICGNAILDAGEVCDDGNTADGDGCSGTCLSDETCGNGVVDAITGETCDDGNTVSGDGCQANCALPVCGDGTVDPGEVCDDGNTTAGDGCDATCTSDESCGNGILDAAAGETCDDGNTTPGDGCSATCQTEMVGPVCGNGVIEAGEACDDGNTVSGDGCSSTCQSETMGVCGDGTIDMGETCDDGNTVSGDGCSATCQTEMGGVCGDGVIDAGETCDDGNTVSGDGCSSTCQSETVGVCGDGTINAGETCDDGNTVSGDGCSSTCQTETVGPSCGDGVVDAGEFCDDGNSFAGDGCGATCQTETGWTCSGSPSNCTMSGGGGGGCNCTVGRSDSDENPGLPVPLALLAGLLLLARRRRR